MYRVYLFSCAKLRLLALHHLRVHLFVVRRRPGHVLRHVWRELARGHLPTDRFRQCADVVRSVAATDADVAEVECVGAPCEASDCGGRQQPGIEVRKRGFA